MLDLFNKRPPWFAGDGPESAVAVCCQCNLIRNLPDFCFPSGCSDEERRAVEERVTGALEGLQLLGSGQYRAMTGLRPMEAEFLAERRLIPFDLIDARGRGGVYVADTQTSSIAINGSDHLCLTVLESGNGLPSVWSKLNELDNRLASALDFAFDRHFGYLTGSLACTGTGLKASVVLHLPGLAMTNSVSPLVQMARERRHGLYGLRSNVITGGLSPEKEERRVSEAFYNDLSGTLLGDISETQGDLYVLTNLSTLGQSEEEIVFHLRQTANDVIARERDTREMLLSEEHIRVEDRIARARGLAGNVRLLGFAEAVSILSALRLGVDAGLIEDCTIERLNELLLAAQTGHLKMQAGRECNEWELSVERANLFRAHFGGAS